MLDEVAPAGVFDKCAGWSPVSEVAHCAQNLASGGLSDRIFGIDA
jgi:hypothetical protein